MKKSKIKQETKLWNFNSSDGQYDENGKIVITNIHKGHKHDIIWHDAKTTTVEDAGRGYPGLNWDCAELMLLIKKTYEDGTECTIFSMGYYDEKRDKKICAAQQENLWFEVFFIKLISFCRCGDFLIYQIIDSFHLFYAFQLCNGIPCRLPQPKIKKIF